jgi:hypothetical protein
MKEWQFQYPSTALTRTVKGDKVYAGQFRGEADKLLYQLKNQMKFNALGQLKMTRYFTDGTIITAWSIFGQDFVDIDTTLAEVVPACIIEFINPPEKMPPMKWYAEGQETFTKIDNAWVIKGPDGNTEVEGVDYLKTYYRLKVKDCGGCSSPLSTVCTTKKLASSKASECYPYTYDASKRLYLGEAVPYFQGWPLKVPPIPPDPENHLIYSFYESGQAEILKFDHDAQGTYFLWKAYTEWGIYPPTDITFSRTGLGYLLLKLFIQSGGNELCQVETIVKVDCCEKDISLRRIQQPDRPGYSGLWWESETTYPPQNCYNQPFMFHGTMKMCEVPSEISITSLYIMACIPVHPVAFYVLPDLNGSCLPFEWTLTGPGIWTTGGNYKEIGYYGCAGIGCHDDITINVTDRCGTATSVHTKSCCETAGELSISYTSLLMSCGQQQTFYAIGGCGPYSWSVTGGGSITQAGVYTAPATNVNCLDNPTIQVTDCCGSSTSISLAINCYTGTYTAFKMSTLLKCCCYKIRNPDCAGAVYNVVYSQYLQAWRCDGVETQACWTGNRTNCDGVCPPPPPCTNYCPCDSVDEADCWGTPGYSSGDCQGAGYNGFDTLTDARTEEMKEAGCCPLNPLTGLPY